MKDVIYDIARLTPSFLKDADLVEKNGSVRWHAALEKAYRRSQRHGWIENRTDGAWYLTAKGRAEADKAAADVLE